MDRIGLLDWIGLVVDILDVVALDWISDPNHPLAALR